MTSASGPEREYESIHQPEVVPARTKGNATSNTSHKHHHRHHASGTASKSSAARPNARSQTLLINSKIRHIKKKDGDPLWRRDIQYDFLKAIFYDETRVFTNSYDGSPNHTYSEIYIDAMARSSKSSRVLREKLLGDRQAGLNIAMVCLLVNIGRMNTTLNFFPEMRAQLRTYHPIPSLQTYSDPTAYKQLQDAPRLKSILKGACEDRPEPSTLDQLLLQPRLPRTNPINLVFILATYARRVTDVFFVEPYEFYDFIMNTNLSSESRAKSFLWLMWVYLESDLSPEQLRANPFGYGQEGGMKVPAFTVLTPQQIENENVDSVPEKEFAERMIRERQNYLEHLATATPDGAVPKTEDGSNPPKKKRIVKKKDPDLKINAEREAGNDAASNSDASQRTVSAASPGPAKLSSRPPRKQTKAELAAQELMAAREKKCMVEIEHLIRVSDRRRKRARYAEGAMKRTWRKIRTRDPFEQSEDEQTMINAEMMASAASSHKRKNIDLTTLNNHIMSSLSGVRDSNLGNDFGEESRSLATAFRRANRWIARWNNVKDLTDRSNSPSERMVMSESAGPVYDHETSTYYQPQDPKYDEAGPQMVPMR